MQIPFIKNKTIKRHAIFAACLFVVAWFLFAHPDILETANHSYLFLENLFGGNILHFYENVMAHENTLYYINNAHYNIVVYAIFGVFLLPVFIVNKLFLLPVQEVLIYFIAKLVAIGFFLGCIYLTYRIAKILLEKEEESLWAGLNTALWPPAFFAACVMGQYDSICLFFTLLGILCWLEGNLQKAAIWFGVGAACKFFPLMLFAPLILLKEKRPLQILKYGILSLWLTFPAALLFRGRTGDMSVFNGLMIDRVFAARFGGGVEFALFPVAVLFICIVAYLWRPRREEDTHKAGIWLGVIIFGLLFLLVDWHPQWFLLLAPFLAITTALEEDRLLWGVLDVVLSVGFFLRCAIYYPGMLEANLLDFGLIGIFTNYNTLTMAGTYNTTSFYIVQLAPILLNLAPVLFCTPLLAHIVLKAPYKSKTIAAALEGGKETAKQPLPEYIYVWGIFFAGFGCWLLPVAFTWLKKFGIF